MYSHLSLPHNELLVETSAYEPLMSVYVTGPQASYFASGLMSLECGNDFTRHCFDSTNAPVIAIDPHATAVRSPSNRRCRVRALRRECSAVNQDGSVFFVGQCECHPGLGSLGLGCVWVVIEQGSPQHSRRC
jgi:hypothetical protein